MGPVVIDGGGTARRPRRWRRGDLIGGSDLRGSGGNLQGGNVLT
jgi:hypothetical protein